MDMRIHMRWHLPLGSTATLLLCVVMVFLSLPPAVARGQTPAAADTQTPNLAAKSRKDKLPSELARSVRDAIVDGRYEAASQVGEAVLAKSRITAWRYYPFTNFIAAISNDNDVRFEARLSQWVSADPQAALPTLVRAQYYYDTAWFRRGHRFDNDTLPADLAAFHDNLRRARTDVESAIELTAQTHMPITSSSSSCAALETFRGSSAFSSRRLQSFPPTTRSMMKVLRCANRAGAEQFRRCVSSWIDMQGRQNPTLHSRFSTSASTEES